MLCWYLVQLNFWEHEEGDNDQTGQNMEEHIGSSVDVGSTVDIPFNVLSLAGIMLLVLIIQSYRNLALRYIRFENDFTFWIFVRKYAKKKARGYIDNILYSSFVYDVHSFLKNSTRLGMFELFQRKIVKDASAIFMKANIKCTLILRRGRYVVSQQRARKQGQ